MPRGRDYASTESAWPEHEPPVSASATRGAGTRAANATQTAARSISAWRSATASPATRACRRPRALAGSDAAPRVCVWECLAVVSEPRIFDALDCDHPGAGVGVDQLRGRRRAQMGRPASARAVRQSTRDSRDHASWPRRGARGRSPPRRNDADTQSAKTHAQRLGTPRARMAVRRPPSAGTVRAVRRRVSWPRGECLRSRSSGLRR